MARQKEIDPERSREAAARAPGDHAQAALLAVGDLVVYASHGIGRIESRVQERTNGELLVLVFESGMRVTLPLERGQNALRPLSGEPELGEVQRTLGGDSPPAALEHWSRRHRNAQAKLVGGSVGGLAEIVRDGAHRERARLKGALRRSETSSTERPASCSSRRWPRPAGSNSTQQTPGSASRSRAIRSQPDAQAERVTLNLGSTAEGWAD